MKHKLNSFLRKKTNDDKENIAPKDNKKQENAKVIFKSGQVKKNPRDSKQ
eukprot:TRINITY_DN1660_c0_g1_i1.p4 TRINITY_DN1660_c0_g1~~TRINITY_DN1660_c0_g1_i1.p4  ORF type:complete len:50 (-),score=9.90 TRINITY_DN1660_c0_g1_i1:95-244(-)